MRRAPLIAGILIVTALAWPGRVSAEPPPADSVLHDVLVEAPCGERCETLAPPNSPPAVLQNVLVPDEEVLVRIHGRKFLPGTVRVHAGRKTKLVFRNEDAELHVFAPGTLFDGISVSVEGNGAPEFGEQGFRKVIIPGDGMAELHFILPQPGRYPFICDMPGHEMRGTIVVE